MAAVGPARGLELPLVLWATLGGTWHKNLGLMSRELGQKWSSPVFWASCLSRDATAPPPILFVFCFKTFQLIKVLLQDSVVKLCLKIFKSHSLIELKMHLDQV